MDSYRIHEDDDFNQSFIVLSSLRKKKLKFKNEFFEKYNIMDADFERNHFSRTEKSIYLNGHRCIRLMNLMAYYQRYCENINYFDLMTSVLFILNESSRR